MGSIYVKKSFGPIGFEAAKITEENTLEVNAGGAMEAVEIPWKESLDGLIKRGFVKATKEEYNAIVKRAVKEINALV